MAGSVNKILLLGNLGKDPDIRYTDSGTANCQFTLATNESFTDKQGQRQDRTEWHRVVTWGKTAELCGTHLSKGRQVYIEGKIQTRQYDDRDGQKRYVREVVASTVQFLGSKHDGAQIPPAELPKRPSDSLEQPQQQEFKKGSTWNNDKKQYPEPPENRSATGGYKPRDAGMDEDELPF